MYYRGTSHRAGRHTDQCLLSICVHMYHTCVIVVSMSASGVGIHVPQVTEQAAMCFTFDLGVLQVTGQVISLFPSGISTHACVYGSILRSER